MLSFKEGVPKKNMLHSLVFGFMVFLFILLIIGDIHAQMTTRVSVDSFGNEGNERSLQSSISADGRYVAYCSEATNLVPNDTNRTFDCFVHDRQTGNTTRVSVDSSGIEGNGSSPNPSISADGRYVAFESYASNFVPNDTNGVFDIFVHDRQVGNITRISVDSSGIEGNDVSLLASISADGRYVAFISLASNLVPNDTNNTWDCFVHDRQTGNTTRISIDSSGIEGNCGFSSPSISADGRYVAFSSGSDNLVPNDTNGESDCFVHDLQTGNTTRVSVDSSGIEGNDGSFKPSISADGRYIAFVSEATNLVPNDTNNASDCFVHDLQTGNTTRVSVDSSGIEGNDKSFIPSISADGRYIVFYSDATNLVPNDTNSKDDCFVHDRQTGNTTRVSVDSSGIEGNGTSFKPSISADGRYVSFQSYASNLVFDDTNGYEDIFVHDRYGSKYMVNGNGTGGGDGRYWPVIDVPGVDDGYFDARFTPATVLSGAELFSSWCADNDTPIKLGWWYDNAPCYSSLNFSIDCAPFVNIGNVGKLPSVNALLVLYREGEWDAGVEISDHTYFVTNSDIQAIIWTLLFNGIPQGGGITWQAPLVEALANLVDGMEPIYTTGSDIPITIIIDTTDQVNLLEVPYWLYEDLVAAGIVDECVN